MKILISIVTAGILVAIIVPITMKEEKTGIFSVIAVIFLKII